MLGAAGNYPYRGLTREDPRRLALWLGPDNLTPIVLRRYKLEGAVQIRQTGGTTEMAAAFQRAKSAAR
jgi:hypothetical protein